MKYKVYVPFIVDADSEEHSRVMVSIQLRRKGVVPRIERILKRGVSILVENIFGYDPFVVEKITN